MRLDVVTLPNGRRALVVDSPIPDDVPEVVREGLARRAVVNRGGICPCGARPSLPNRAARRRGRVVRVLVEHEPDCPAADARITEALGGGSRG